jgi:hypothetical protein
VCTSEKGPLRFPHSRPVKPTPQIEALDSKLMASYSCAPLHPISLQQAPTLLAWADSAYLNLPYVKRGTVISDHVTFQLQPKSSLHLPLHSYVHLTPIYQSMSVPQPAKKKNVVMASHGRAPWYGPDGKNVEAYVIGIAGGSASGKVSY